VHAFLEGRIGFLDIAATVEHTLERMPRVSLDSLPDVYNLDKAARELAAELATPRARSSGRTTSI
jgi:1-deoxy-D-xylulose-5-phosphate reductoisomerase